MTWANRHGNSDQCPNSVEFRRDREQSSEQARYIYLRGKKSLASKDYDRAISEFSQAIKLDDNMADAYNGMGDAYYFKKDYSPAVENYSIAISRDEKNYLYFENRCYSYVNQAEYEKADADAGRALLLNDNAYAAYRCRAWLYSKQDKLSAALYNYKLALAHIEDNDNEKRSSALSAISNIKSRMEKFEFKICNNTEKDAYIANIGKQERDDPWRMVYWTKVKANECETIGTYQRNSGVYWLGYQNKSWWTGDSGPYCVDSMNVFRGNLSENSCEGGVNKMFYKIQPLDSQQVVTQSIK